MILSKRKIILLVLFLFAVFLVSICFGSKLQDVQATTPVALTPPMGWSTWNLLGCGDGISEGILWDENTIKSIADAMITSGLKDVGYEYINLDDCWGQLDQAERRVSDSLKYDTKKFPSGINSLADYIHSKGLKLGLYTSFSTRTCQWRWGSLDHEQQDIDTFASWGVDYLKVDYCKDLTNNLDTRIPELVQRYRSAIDTNGRPMVLSIAPHQPSTWAWAPSLVNLWRFDSLSDIKNSWPSILSILDNPDLHHPEVVSPGHWADPDMLEVGVDPVIMPPGMTETEYRSHFSLWSILAAPLILGNDIRNMSVAVKSILINPEVIAINQDQKGKQGIRIKQSGSAEIWLKDLQNSNTKAVVLFNRGASSQNITVNWSDISLPAGTNKVRDLWAQQDKGLFTNSFTANVSSHGVVMIKVGEEPATTLTPTPTPCNQVSDINRDCQTNAADLLLVLRSWLGTGSCSGFNCNLNADNKVNGLDAGLVVANFGR